jgi:hypothetical protein
MVKLVINQLKLKVKNYFMDTRSWILSWKIESVHRYSESPKKMKKLLFTNFVETYFKWHQSCKKVKLSFSLKQHWTCKNVSWMSYLKAHNDEDQNDSSDQDFPLLRQLRRRAGVWNCLLVHDWKESWSLTSFISII